jgi:hypothetical protein
MSDTESEYVPPLLTGSKTGHTLPLSMDDSVLPYE